MSEEPGIVITGASGRMGRMLIRTVADSGAARLAGCSTQPASRAAPLSATVRISIRPMRPEAPVMTMPGSSLMLAPFTMPAFLSPPLAAWQSPVAAAPGLAYIAGMAQDRFSRGGGPSQRQLRVG